MTKIVLYKLIKDGEIQDGYTNPLWVNPWWTRTYAGVALRA